MPHLRERHILPLITKRLKFSRVLAVQGARQTGKSVLVRDILAKNLPHAKYVTFDARSLADFAQNKPDTFLASYEEARPLIIDEAQKAPAIFDAIKLVVDQDPRPGQYLILGSTEFSHLTRVRESLTGRMGRIRLYPLTLSEAHGLPLREFKLGRLFLDRPRLTRSQFVKHIRTGGMPGIFAVRDEAERMRLFEDWLKLTCERDAMQIPGLKIEPELCFAILEQIAKLDEPTAGQIAKALKRDLRKVKNHLLILETLFVVQKILPHALGTGKPVYFLLDVALTHFLGATFQKCLLTLVKTELDALLAYHDVPFAKTTFFHSRGGGQVHFIIETSHEMAAVKILDQETLDLRELEILKSFAAKSGGKKMHSYALGAGRFSLKKEKIEVYPWESVG